MKLLNFSQQQILIGLQLHKVEAEKSINRDQSRGGVLKELF